MRKLLFITALLAVFSVEGKRRPWFWKENRIVPKLSWQSFLRASKPGVLHFGPTAYWMKRSVVESGAYQAGWLGGFQLGYDRIKRGSFYWGGGLGWGAGLIRGKTASGRPSRSHTQDFHVEVRLGHTFWPKLRDTFYFTPFAAFGNFRNINTTAPPTATRIKNFYQFPYLGFGFISSRFFTPWFSVGITFETQLMFDGKDIKYVEGRAREKLPIDPKAQFLVEMPFIYQIAKKERGFALQASPFYNFRYYGEKTSEEAFFPETRFHVAGLKLYITYRF